MLPRRPERFLVAGNTVFDILVRPVEQVGWNATAFVESIAQQLGGNGANTSYALARMGARVQLLAWIGRDLFGGAAMDKLAEAGVDLSVVVRSESPTATSVVLVNPNGDRAFLQQPGISREAFPEPVDFAPSPGAHFHLGNPFSLPRMRRHAAATLQRAREAGWTTSLDAAWDAMGEWTTVMDPCLPWIDLLFVNEDECRRLSREQDPDRGAAFFQAAGVGQVVVKTGAAGCRIYTRDQRLLLDGFRVECVDTTGAGDVFAGVYLAALSRGLTDAEAGRMANAAGARCVERLGAVTGVCGWDELESWAEKQSAPEPR